MKRMLTATAAAIVGVASLCSAAFAQPGQARGHDDRGGPPGQARGHDDRGGSHNWRKGERMDRHEWSRYKTVDWRSHRLRQPPRGYEWREVNGKYVLAAAATGLIASVIAASR